MGRTKPLPKPETLSVAERDFFEERAAIREYVGNQTREEAEKGAWEELARWRKAQKVEKK